MFVILIISKNEDFMNNTVDKKAENTHVMVSDNKKGKHIHIVTHLIGKDEVFQMLALAEAASLPILLEGPPGVGKTNVVTDYAAASHDRTTEEGEKAYQKSVYILETDEGTRSSEVKGRMNMKEFMQNGEWKLIAPITTSSYIIINEIDKANPGLRNAFLGIMNEKILFNGEDKVSCPWNLFVGTCNVIPADEKGNPFWDRFILKMKVERMNMQLMESYFKAGDKNYTKAIDLYIPTKEEIQAVNIPEYKLKAFLDVAYQHLSDRTLTYVPRLVKTASIVYNCRIDAALVKIASIMINETAANTLSKKLTTPEMRAVLDKVDLIPGIKSKDHYERTMNEINLLVSTYTKGGKLGQEQIEEIKSLIEEVEEKVKHRFTKVELVD